MALNGITDFFSRIFTYPWKMGRSFFTFARKRIFFNRGYKCYGTSRSARVRDNDPDKITIELTDFVYEFTLEDLKYVFGKEYSLENFDWKFDSRILATYHTGKFDLWWDPEKFNYRYSPHLAQNCWSHFHDWWNSEKYDWEFGSSILAFNCPDYFSLWWNPEKFNYDEVDLKVFDDFVQGTNPFSHINYNFPEAKTGSGALCRFCPQHFDQWWNPEKFCWSKDSKNLILYCSEHFPKWWNPDLFNWECQALFAEKIGKIPPRG